MVAYLFVDMVDTDPLYGRGFCKHAPCMVEEGRIYVDIPITFQHNAQILEVTYRICTIQLHTERMVGTVQDGKAKYTYGHNLVASLCRKFHRTNVELAMVVMADLFLCRKSIHIPLAFLLVEIPAYIAGNTNAQLWVF